MTNRELTRKQRNKLPEARRKNIEPFDVLGTGNVAFGAHLVQQVFDGTCLRNIEDQEAQLDLLEPGFLALKELAPRDSIEGMLVSQMISAHNAAMDCFGRAMTPEQTTQSRDMNLRHAEKLTKLYTDQIDALQKYRGNRLHSVTVEQVNVEAGGQAIVGDVHHSSASEGKKSDE